MFCGPTFISEMLLVAKLNSQFLYEKTTLKLMSAIGHLVKQKMLFAKAIEITKLFLDWLIQNQNKHR